MSFNQLAPTVPTILNCSNCFVYSNSSSGNALSVQQLGAGNCLSVSNASGVVGLFVSSLGRVGIGQTNPQATFHSIVNPVTNGFDAILGQMIVKSYSLSLSTTVGAYSNICTIATQLGAFAVDLDVVCDQNNQTCSKSYRAAFAYGGAASGWTTLGAISTGYGQNPFEVDIYNAVSQISYTFRLRRINGTVTGPFLCTFRIYYGPNASGITITDTPSPATGTGATSIGVYTGTPIYTLNGNVGIGTTNPSCKFNVDNGTGTGLNSFIQASGITAGGTTGFLLGKALSTYNCGTLNWNHIGDGLGTNYLGIGAYANDNKLVVTAGGNVGIGTTSPQAALQVNGDFLIGQGAGSYSYNSLAIQYDGNASYGSIIGKGIQWDGTNYKIQTDGLNTRCSAIQMSWDGGFRFITTAAGGGSNLTLTPAQLASNVKAVITNGGYVGIGTASPVTTLDVRGPAPAQSLTAGYYFQNNTPNLVAAGAGSYGVQAYFSSVVAAGAFQAFSDRRIKQDVRDIQDALSTINNIRPVSYHYIDKLEKGSGLCYGFIAQEVEQVLPDSTKKLNEFVPNIFRVADSITGNTISVVSHGLTVGSLVKFISKTEGWWESNVVTVSDANTFTVEKEDIKEKDLFVYGEKVTDYTTLDYEHVFSIGLAAIKELSAENTALKARLDSLEQRLAAAGL